MRTAKLPAQIGGGGGYMIRVTEAVLYRVFDGFVVRIGDVDVFVEPFGPQI